MSKLRTPVMIRSSSQLQASRAGACRRAGKKPLAPEPSLKSCGLRRQARHRRAERCCGSIGGMQRYERRRVRHRPCGLPVGQAEGLGLGHVHLIGRVGPGRRERLAPGRETPPGLVDRPVRSRGAAGCRPGPAGCGSGSGGRARAACRQRRTDGVAVRIDHLRLRRVNPAVRRQCRSESGAASRPPGRRRKGHRPERGARPAGRGYGSKMSWLPFAESARTRRVERRVIVRHVVAVEVVGQAIAIRDRGGSRHRS